MAVVFSRLSVTKDSDSTVVGVGLPPETLPVLLLYEAAAPNIDLRLHVLTLLQLFGGSAFAKEYLFHLQDYNKATWFQNFVASIAGASASLVVSAPLDVIKTRIQNRNFENPESGFRILSNMARNEGFSSFFKGLVPKVRQPPPTPPHSWQFLEQALIHLAAAPHDRSQARLLLLAGADADPGL